MIAKLVSGVHKPDDQTYVPPGFRACARRWSRRSRCERYRASGGGQKRRWRDGGSSPARTPEGTRAGLSWNGSARARAPACTTRRGAWTARRWWRRRRSRWSRARTASARARARRRRRSRSPRWRPDLVRAWTRSATSTSRPASPGGSSCGGARGRRAAGRRGNAGRTARRSAGPCPRRCRRRRRTRAWRRRRAPKPSPRRRRARWRARSRSRLT